MGNANVEKCSPKHFLEGTFTIGVAVRPFGLKSERVALTFRGFEFWIFGKSQTCPENYPETSQNFLGYFPEISQNIPRNHLKFGEVLEGLESSGRLVRLISTYPWIIMIQ